MVAVLWLRFSAAAQGNSVLFSQRLVICHGEGVFW